LFFAHGSGSNGKTTFFETINALEGDYGQKAPKSLFTKNPRGGDEQTNDLARLPGVRFLFGSEVENGSSMAESKVKDITGGDMITARFLHKEFFDFAPTHKLLMFGNHKPRISGTDNGIWRRIRLIPFLKTFEGAEKDPDLADKLRAELPGILNWAIKGCREWQKHGLRTPEVVERATNDYRNQEDLVGEFLTEEYIITKDSIHTLPKKELYNVYRTFCEANGYSPLGVRRFNEQVLTRPGVQEDRISTARIYRGLHHVDQP
jgi:putative DNA primase/helicase